MSYKSDKIKRLLVSFDEGLIEKIEIIAKKENRSRNSQILHWVEEKVIEHDDRQSRSTFLSNLSSSNLYNSDQPNPKI